MPMLTGNLYWAYNSRMRNIRVLLRGSCLTILSAIVVGLLPTVSSTQAVDSTYENVQRARSLLSLENEIKSLQDVEVRSQLRFNILEFIYSKEVRSEYVNAEAMLITLFEEMAANEKRLVYRNPFWRNKTALLLRKHDPETAKKIEAKYIPIVDTSAEDLDAIRPGINFNEVVERTIDGLNKRQDLGSVLNIYERVRRYSPESGSRILDAAFKVSEKKPVPRDASTLYIMIDQVLNQPAPAVSPEHLLKYYRILVTASGIELGKGTVDGAYVATMWPLRRALPKIKAVDLRLYSEAQSIVSKYRTLISKNQLAKEEAEDRIEAAADKLERAIVEAEGAGPDLKDYLWGRASQIASIQKNYKQAVDLLMKAKPTVGTDDQPGTRDLQLSYLANRAQNLDGGESARYAIGFIQDDTLRARTLLDYAFDYGRMTYTDRPKAVEIAYDAIGQLERAGPTPDSICTVGNIRHIVPPITVGDLTARTVRLLNMVQPGDLSVKAGNIDQKTIAMRPLTRTLPCVSYLFRPILNMQPSDLDLVNQIKVKEWRLAARIEVEKARRFPLAQ